MNYALGINSEHLLFSMSIKKPLLLDWQIEIQKYLTIRCCLLPQKTLILLLFKIKKTTCEARSG